MSASVVQPCSDLSDVLVLREPSLYLKPIARVTIAVQLPKSLGSASTNLSSAGKTISNWEVMEKLKSLAKPIMFSFMKVTTSNLEAIRYEGEVDNKELMLKVIHQLEDQTIKLSGFSEVLRVQCVQAKLNFPQRHDWTAFFRDAQNLNELKPGERPDTVFLQNLPSKWFSAVPDGPNIAAQAVVPSLEKMKEIFGYFGKVRGVDVPSLDPSRNKKAGADANGVVSFGSELVFEAFVQFTEYNSFVKCLAALNGMKLLWKEADDTAFTANMKVDFDKTQHMSDKNIKKRRQERVEYLRLEKLKLEKLQKEAEEAEKRRATEEERAAAVAAEKLEKQRRREERRRQRRLLAVKKAEEKRKKHEEEKRHHEVLLEERKLLIAQRQLESIRLLSVLFDRLKEKREVELAELERVLREEEEKRQKEEARQHEVDKEAEFRTMLAKKEKELRDALLKVKRKKDRKELKKARKRQKADKKVAKKARNDVTVEDDNRTAEVARWLDENFSTSILKAAPNPVVRAHEKVLKPAPDPVVPVHEKIIEQHAVQVITSRLSESSEIPGSPVRSEPRLGSFVIVVPAAARTSNGFFVDDEPDEAPVPELNILYC